jgi:glycosyltransferase involved in cell wall biosynthesis
MEQNPLVSVIIPTHNRAELLTTRAIPSVLNQTYQCLELIIVADNCTDDTKERVQNIKDSRVRFVELTDRPPLPDDLHARWRVAAAAPRNNGFEMAKGEWITQLDDDDEFTPNHIEILLQRALTGYDFVYGNILAIKPNGEQAVIGKYPPEYGNISTQSYLISSKYKNIKFNTDPTATWEPEDWNFCRRVIEAGARVSYIDEVVCIQYLPLRDYQRLLEMEWTGERFLPWIEGSQMHYEHLHRYALAAHFAKGKRVLDLACGEGYGTYMLAKKAEYVAGVEIDNPTVQHARSRYSKDNLEFIEGSILAVPIESEKKFDVVVCFEVIEHIAEHDKLLSEVKRLLKDDGLLIVSTPNKAIYTDAPDYRDPFHVKELYVEEFTSLLRRYFKHSHIFGQRVYAGSNMWSTHDHKFRGYVEEVVKKGDMEFYSTERTNKEPVHFIALASDASLRPSTSITDSWLTDVSNTVFNDYEKQLQHKDARISSLDTNLQEKVSHIYNLESHIRRLEYQIYQMQQSIPMQLGRRYVKVTERLLPSGTRRRDLYLLVLTGARVMLSQGFGAFCSTACRFITNRGIFRIAKIGWSRLGSKMGYRPHKPLVPDLELTTVEEAGITPSESDTISVVIPTKNGGSDLELLLLALKQQKGLKELEVIVVDSGSSDESVSIARAHGAKLVQILPEEFSHSRARNLGAEQATGNYLFFTVQDALPSSGLFLFKLLSALKSNGVAAVSCAEFPKEDADLFYRTNNWHHYSGFLGVSENDRVMRLPKGKSYEKLRKNAQLSDIACLLPKEIFQKYKYSRNYAEDLDLGLRLVEDGHNLALLGSVSVIHSHNRPAYYWLKRAYVDTLGLVDVFPSYRVPKVNEGEVFRSMYLTYHLLTSLADEELGHMMHQIDLQEFFYVVSKRLSPHGQPMPLPDHLPDTRYADSNLKTFLEKLFEDERLDSDWSMTDNVIGRAVSDHMNLVKRYMERTYRVIDPLIAEDFKSCLFKTYAAKCGAYLAYLSIDKTHVVEWDKELRKGI